MPLPDRPVLLYDDGCRFCRACVALMARWDRAGRMALLPWSEPLAREWMAALPAATRDRSMHVQEPEGPLRSGGDALIAVLAALPGSGWLARLAERVGPLRGTLAWGYALVARNRGPLSRVVPERPAVVRRPGLR